MSGSGGGIRYNHGKTPYQMIPLFLLAGAARVFHAVTTRKEKPYPAWNWLRGMAWSGPYACAIRHLDAWYRGEPFDPETGESHLDHVICNLLMLRHYEDVYAQGDDRPPLHDPASIRPDSHPTPEAIEVYERRMNARSGYHRGKSGMTAHEERAWQLYCRETAGSMDVKDFWSELSPSVQRIFLDKSAARHA